MIDDRLRAAREAAERWAIFDPDHVTRGRIDRLVDAVAPSLIELFEGRLAFGTAGLRAPVGPGPNRMNALVVRQATAGVMGWLATEGEADRPVVVIGFDARTDSADFATHAAAAVTAAGGVARLADRAVPTPVVAHAVLSERADAGIVITASHNPPGDNGYKLYLGDGRQIVAPVEEQVAAHIDAVASAWADHAPGIDDAFADPVASIDAELWLAAHRSDAVAAAQVAAGNEVRVAYTAMHGVGGRPTMAAFAQAGLVEPVIVESQFEPDGTFWTVAFPNPEEPGALDHALAAAEREQVHAIVAHDPDADRLALAVRDGVGIHRNYRALSGDELGVLLGDHLLRRAGPAASRCLVARSVVSSRLLDAVAESYGAACAVTLTGFKWIARAGDDHPDLTWLFGYEEALGYCVGTHVRDKDGITAALVAVDMIGDLDRRGLSVWDRLDQLAQAHGHHASRPVTVRFDDDPGAAARAVDALVATPPGELGDAAVTSAGPIGGGTLAPTPGIEIHLQDRSRVIVRPSGTEPKLKAYLEVIAESRPEAQTRLDAVGVACSNLLDALTQGRARS